MQRNVRLGVVLNRDDATAATPFLPLPACQRCGLLPQHGGPCDALPVLINSLGVELTFSDGDVASIVTVPPAWSDFEIQQTQTLCLFCNDAGAYRPHADGKVCVPCVAAKPSDMPELCASLGVLAKRLRVAWALLYDAAEAEASEWEKKGAAMASVTSSAFNNGALTGDALPASATAPALMPTHFEELAALAHSLLEVCWAVIDTHTQAFQAAVPTEASAAERHRLDEITRWHTACVVEDCVKRVCRELGGLVAIKRVHLPRWVEATAAAQAKPGDKRKRSDGGGDDDGGGGGGVGFRVHEEALGGDGTGGGGPGEGEPLMAAEPRPAADKIRLLIRSDDGAAWKAVSRQRLDLGELLRRIRALAAVVPPDAPGDAVSAAAAAATGDVADDGSGGHAYSGGSAFANDEAGAPDSAEIEYRYEPDDGNGVDDDAHAGDGEEGADNGTGGGGSDANDGAAGAATVAAEGAAVHDATDDATAK